MMHRMHKNFALRVTLYAALLPMVTAIGAQTQSAPAPAWNSYSYPADGFSVSFPSAPTIDKKNVPTDAGNFELRSYIATVGTNGDVAMFVGVCDYGTQAAGRNPDDMLQGAKNGALKNSNSHLLSETKTMFGIYHGLTFEAESDQAHFSARIYMVGTTLYQMLVVWPLGKPYADTTRFMDSFQLIPRTAQ